jgi:hypothetical protein
MKKTLVFLLLFTLSAACSDEEVTPEEEVVPPKEEVVTPKPKNITTVAALTDVAVAFATEFKDLILPDKILVTYSDNTTESIGISFSSGSYNSREAGKYVLSGDLRLTEGTTNVQGLKGTINVTVAAAPILKLKTITEDGILRFEYFYDASGRLDYFKAFDAQTEYHYIYSPDNKVGVRIRKYAGSDYPEKYYYHADGTLDRVEFYDAESMLDVPSVLINTRTYTYENGSIARYDNSDQSIPMLRYRTFVYESPNVISIVSFDTGNPWNFTYVTDKKMATPLVLDLADPQNQTSYPVETFTYVEMSSYTAEYTYNIWNYPVEEVRTYPGDGNRQSVIVYTYE